MTFYISRHGKAVSKETPPEENWFFWIPDHLRPVAGELCHKVGPRMAWNHKSNVLYTNLKELRHATLENSR